MSKPINFDIPSPETLAGINIYVEGEEDLTVRPGKIKPVLIKQKPENGTPKTPRRRRTKSKDAKRNA